LSTVAASAPNLEIAGTLVSVVVPCYNQGRFLAECVRSIEAQTHRPLEIIVVNDGSTDNTAEVAKSFGHRIVYVEQENSGPAAARNKGIERARGDVIAFCDADDLLFPDCLKKRLSLLIADPLIGLVSGNLSFIDEDGKDLGISPEPFEAPFRIDFYRALTKNWGGTCGTLIKRRALVECGLMDPMLITCEDWELQVRIAKNRGILFDPEPLSAARQVRMSLSRDPILVYDDARKLLRKVRAYADNGFRFWRASQSAKFNNVVGFTFFRIRRETRGLARWKLILRTLAMRPSMIPYLVAWIGRSMTYRIVSFFRSTP
jgi:glycosyltransferase involved in cell wall biosynthesis